MNHQNIVLIGMPGAGKSTLGVLLAKTLGKSFLDTDLLIQEKEGRLLQAIIDQDGVAKFLQIEARVLRQVEIVNAVIATGGSVVYDQNAMKHLGQNGIIVYLQLPYAEIECRISNMASRGIALGAGQRLIDLYNERTPLYERYADLVVDCSAKTLEAAVQSIVTTVLDRFGDDN